jgi:hypothetical protein
MVKNNPFPEVLVCYVKGNAVKMLLWDKFIPE